ncbi:hypothetical protein [Flavobacterium pedocola]
MKTKLLLLLASSGLLFSCSSDDSGSGDDNSSNFAIPLETGKYWTYDVNDGTTESRDSLYIKGDSLINGITYKRFQVRDNVATGFYSSSLRNNGVRESDGKLLLSGDLSLAAGQDLPVDLDLVLSDFIIFKKSATNNEQLSSKSGTINQEFGGYPITINYTLKSFGGESLPTFTSPNGDVYNDVKTSKIVLRASITTVVTVAGIPITQSVLADQDVMISTQYVVNNVGVGYVNTVTQYQMNPTIATTLGVPATGTQTQQEFLDTHN